MRIIALLCVLCLIPAASAGHQAAVYYLGDEANQGVLVGESPTNNESKTRPVTPQVDAPPVLFYSEEAVTDRLFGPAFVGLWTQNNAVLAGNMSASLWLLNGSDLSMLASVDVNIALDPENAPDPESLVPPDPTDPEQAIFHIASQFNPLISSPPLLLDFGVIDVAMPANSSLVLGFGLRDGDRPGAGVSIIQYDAWPTPSFAYIPWYAEDPAWVNPVQELYPPSTSSNTMTSTSMTSSGPSGSQSGSQSSSAPDEDSPGLPLVGLLAVLGVVVLLRRKVA